MKQKKEDNKVVPLIRLLFLSAVIAISLLSAPDLSHSGISGVCDDCHTMHNSQNGESITGNGPSERLLSSDCIGCHSAPSGKLSSFGAPVVLHTAAPAGQGGNRTTAGGDFYWVDIDENGNAAKGHNVIDLPNVTHQDGTIGMTPPGWDPSATLGFPFGQVANGETLWTNQLTCGGMYGCHGDHSQQGSFAGIRGTHHGNLDGPATRANQADSIAASYRFLGGIKGLEDADWNWNETASQHNEYYGVNNRAAERDADGITQYSIKDTISFFCAECHGIFHSEIDADSTSGSPWVRHPTDIVMPNIPEYEDYNSDNDDDSPGDYSVEAPLARGAVPNSSSNTVNIGNTGVFGSIVMCLSCHRAHGSPEDDLLRWTYTDMVAGSGTTGGCFTCHTDKN